MQNRTFRSLITQFINFITFVDLPIRKKFVLFAIGTLFWFFVLFAVIILALFDLEGEADIIVKRVLPQERAAQQIIGAFQQLNIDALEIVRGTDTEEVMLKGERGKARLDDIIAGLVTFKETRALSKRAALQGILADESTEAGNYAQSVTAIEAASTKAKVQLADLVNVKLAALKGNLTAGPKSVQKLGEVRKTIDAAREETTHLAAGVAGLYAISSDKISESIHFALTVGILVLAIATALLVLFTYWIARSIARPVNSIINQIHSLSTGDVDLSKRIVVASRDEIGTLSSEFNGLMESIHGMNVFKKVIEEDESLEDVYSRLGKAIREQHGLADYMIYEISNSKNKIRPVYPVVLATDTLPCNPEILDNCDLCKAKKTGHEVSSLTYPEICKQFMGEEGTEHLCVPMIIGGSAGGVVQFRFTRPTDPLEAQQTEQKIFRARQYVRESVSVIEAKRLMGSLRDSALKDPLTGLHNRRFLQEYTENLVAGARRRGKNIGLIMCDLDYFKQVNDVHGHNVGDAVLKETSLLIRKSVREADIVIRFGGEEFLVVLLDLTTDSSMVVAEKIRSTLEKARIQVPHGPEITKTISLGVSEFPADTELFWQAIKFADVALYRAKDTGRNRAVRFSREMWTEQQF